VDLDDIFGNRWQMLVKNGCELGSGGHRYRIVSDILLKRLRNQQSRHRVLQWRKAVVGTLILGEQIDKSEVRLDLCNPA
jgi:hypothetical protein